MPYLEDITYSRQGCINAVRDFYNFLIKLHLPSHYLVEPPEGGWPHITIGSTRDFGKSDEVVQLLRHLPYLRSNEGDHDAHGAPDTRFADWSALLRIWQSRQSRDVEDLMIITEGAIIYETSIPPHIFSLTEGNSATHVFLLDTQLGVIHWLDCPYEVKGLLPTESYPEGILDRAADHAATEEEAEWRSDSGTWAIDDFFEMLKDQFNKLHFYPVGSGRVRSIWHHGQPRDITCRDEIRETIRSHGWPDMTQYRKEECLEAVNTIVSG